MPATRWVIAVRLQIPEPILAAPVAALPTSGVAYEGKWDGYRCLLARHPEGRVEMRSRRGTVLTVAFSDIAAAAQRDLPHGVLLDGEGDLARGPPRLRPAATTDEPHCCLGGRRSPGSSRHFVAFDVLHLAGENLMPQPYLRHREQLERFFAEEQLGPPWTLCPMTLDRAEAERWMHEWAQADVGLEGIVAKKLNQPYRPRTRRAWSKVRIRHTTGAVIGGVTGTPAHPTDVLLGRFDATGRLRYAGRSTPLTARTGRQLSQQLAPAAPDHPWRGHSFSAGLGSREKLDVELAEPVLVAEVSADTAVDSGRWRHPVRFVRVRTDMEPQDSPLFSDG
ncbi:ATP-dependent DNA ligase [Streptomyces decoyicus]|uniref:ATP-dependent DNA ligase n=1 Tax=Streptomyces decoyicus TaxID=249567 RepID=UPI00363EC369